MDLKIYRNGIANLTQNIAADGVATFTRQLMGEHKVVCQFQSATELDLKKGDYITLNGIKFTINLPPEITGTNIFTYGCTFESPIYNSYRKVFMDEGNAEFDYNAATPGNILQLWIENMNEIDPGWTIGQVEPNMPVQNFTFSNVKCRDAINTIATQFGLEWFCNNKEIHLVKKVGYDTSLRFAYGKGRGLYQLTRKNIDDKNIVTKLYAFGSDRNIDYTYRNGAKRLTFTGSPLTQNVDNYGIEEGVVNFDDIYPHRESKVTAVGADSLSITDSTLDFDINDYLIGGTTAKISFLDGDLVGQTFEIQANGYNHATKTITFNPLTTDYGRTFPDTDPNKLNIARVGDTYTLIDILMPASYIADAENELKARAIEYLAENSVPRVSYGLTIDPINARKKAIHFDIGDRVNLVDTKLGINAKIRVTAISYPLYDPYQITATIADKVEPTLVQRLIAKDAENSTQIGWVDKRRELDYRRGYENWQRLQDLIFDPSGEYFDPGKIKPESIETLMLSVGAKSQAFLLSGSKVTISADNAHVQFTAAKLSHFNLEIEGLGSTWEIASATLSIPDLAAPYYIYAKCSKTQLSGTWFVSKDQILVDAVPGYYMLSVGAIYEVKDGFRIVGLTYGFAAINGRTIVAGRLTSVDGVSYFDLDFNQLNIGNPNGSGLDYNVSIPNKLVVRDGIVQRSPGVTAPMQAYRGPYDNVAPYFKGDTVVYNGQSYTYKGANGLSGHLPTDTNYWEISAAQGEKGDTGIGIQSTTITYQGSTSGTVVPTGSWVSNPPSVPEGQYLWTRTVIKYTDNSTSTGYSVSKQGESGADGDDGVGITGYTTTYQKSTSGTVAPTGTWTTSIPSVSPSEFLWTRLIISYSDSTTSTSYSVGMMGATGAKGQGTFKPQVFKRSNTPPATPTGGSYANPVPSGWSDGVPAGEEILWVSTRIFTSDGLAPQQSTWTTPSSTSDTADLDYEFSAVTTPGNPTSNPGNWHDGSESTPDDLWMALRTKSNGIWSSWSILKIKGENGEDGTTVLSTVVQYQVSSSGTVIPTGTWVNTIPSVPVGQYLWTRTQINYSNDTTSTGYSVSRMGKDGLDGEDGRGITSATTTYQKSSSGTTVPTGTWVSSPPDTNPGEYLWTRTILTYTDSTTSTIYSVSRNGQDGTDGNYTEHRFAKNGSPTAPPLLATTNPSPAGWTVAQPAVGLLEYLWMTSAVKTAAGALVTNWSTPVQMRGPQGNNGPALTPRGLWESGKTYQGSSLAIDVVKYTDNIWYMARVDAGTIPTGTLPTNSAYWNTFGANFESVATGVFFAEKGTINNLLVQVLETVLQAHTNPNDPESPLVNVSHIVIDGSQPNPFILYDPDGNQVLAMNVFSPGSSNNSGGAGLRVNTKIDGRGVAEITSNGLYANGGGQGWNSLSNGSIVGQLFKRSIDDTHISAAVAGFDNTADPASYSGSLTYYNGDVVVYGGIKYIVKNDIPDGSGDPNNHGITGVPPTNTIHWQTDMSISFGGYFNTLFGGGACFAARRVTADYTLTDRDFFITMASGGNTLYLPANPKTGQYYIIKNTGFSNVVLNDNSTSARIIANSNVAQGSLNLWTGTNYYDMIFVWFDGTYWVANRFVTD